MRAQRSRFPRRQSGTVLIVALVLLLLAGLLTLFSLKVGMFEQRSTGNDARSKAVVEVAEAGLGQGFEYLIRQHAAMLKNAALWEACDAADTTFPCGVITDGTFDHDGDPATAEVSRRASMYRLKAVGTNVIPNLDIALSRHMLPIPAASKVTTLVNGTPVAYGVAPLLCFARAPAGAASGIPCGPPSGIGVTSTAIATFVSVAKLPGENASSTLVQTIGQYPKIGDDLLNKPPITASGTADVTGTLQVVTNPNSGGTGVPVSVWSRLDVDKTGTTNTCYADEFFRYTTGSATPELYQNTIRCDDCRCDSNSAPSTLSFDASGNDKCTAPTADCEGIDVLDVDVGTTSAAAYNTGGHKGANFNVRADSLSFPICEFPPDMFRYVFGTDAWEDTDDDCFAETKRGDVVYQNPDNPGAVRSVGPDEAYLYKIADKIIPTDANLPLVRLAQVGTSALLDDEDSRGVIWCQEDCNIGSGNQVGTPDHPVVLILDGPVTIQGIVFGFVFIRDTGAELDPATGSSLPGACPNDCILQMNAGAAIYGALVMQGQMKSNGTSAVIYDGNVLTAVIEEAGLVYATLPGAWTDRRSY
jgi:hypothetical protein